MNEQQHPLTIFRHLYNETEKLLELTKAYAHQAKGVCVDNPTENAQLVPIALSERAAQLESIRSYLQCDMEEIYHGRSMAENVDWQVPWSNHDTDEVALSVRLCAGEVAIINGLLTAYFGYEVRLSSTNKAGVYTTFGEKGRLPAGVLFGLLVELTETALGRFPFTHYSGDVKQ